MSWDNLQERVYLESQLERRLQLFLFFFIVTIIVSLIISQKEIAMIFLVIAVIISWLLTVSLWVFVNKLNAADKSLPDSEGGGPKFMEKSLRFFLAKVLPISASILLTMFLITGVSGLADAVLPYKQKVADVIEAGKEKIETIAEKSPEKRHFTSVDSVVDNTKITPRKGAEVTVDNSILTQTSKDLAIKEENVSNGGVVKPAPKKVNVLLAVDGSHQAPKQQNEDRGYDELPLQNNASGTSQVSSKTQTQKLNPHFAPVERIIEKTQAETKVVSTKITSLAKKDSTKKKVQPNPNFKNIEQVIKK